MDIKCFTTIASNIAICITGGHEGTIIHVPKNQPMEVNCDLGGMIPKIDDAPWPGFPPDLTSIITVVATQVKRTVLIHEKMFESRMFFVDKLIGMGAQIVLCDPHREETGCMIPMGIGLDIVIE